jgi:hypothetical protein
MPLSIYPAVMPGSHKVVEVMYVCNENNEGPNLDHTKPNVIQTRTRALARSGAIACIERGDLMVKP